MAFTLRQSIPYCLASESPRRAELLSKMGFEVVIRPSRVDESILAQETPQAHVLRLSQSKAQQVAPMVPGHLVLAGDTVVSLEGEILGKPQNPAHARQMLERLSARAHSVFTGYCLLDTRDGRTCTNVVETRVHFRPLPAPWLTAYVASNEGADKAGAYGIQGMGGLMVARIEGSYHNVVGFPVEDIAWDLINQGWAQL